MKFYQLAYLISPELSEKEARDFQEKINSSIQQEGGILIEITPAVKKILAYPIKKKKEGFLASVNFQILPERLLNLEKKIKGQANILRYLILSKKLAKKEIPFPSIKPRIVKPKVELKDIEKKLEEILKEYES